MYFTVASRMSVQITDDNPPMMSSFEKLVPFPVIAWNTYSGDVPISPKTIPIVIRTPAMEAFSVLSAIVNVWEQM